MTRKKVHALFIILYCLLVQFAFADAGNFRLPEGFVYVDEVIPDIKVTLPYYDGHNFVGERIDGYLQPRCILTVQAAQALKGVQDELRRFGLSLKIFDCYRPQQAVDHFVRWAKDLQDTRMKAEFYPDVKKENLFKDGYIATKSGHSRGSTVDLTITAADAAPDAPGLNMATGFDLFGPQSWPSNLAVSPDSRAHRMLLQVLMEKHGFEPILEEWWHFTLKKEPFPDTYFNFPVQ